MGWRDCVFEFPPHCFGTVVAGFYKNPTTNPQMSSQHVARIHPNSMVISPCHPPNQIVISWYRDILFTMPEELLGFPGFPGFPASSKDLPFASSKIFFRKAPICQGSSLKIPHQSGWSKGGGEYLNRNQTCHFNEENKWYWMIKHEIWGKVFSDKTKEMLCVRKVCPRILLRIKVISSVLKHLGYGSPQHDWLSVVSLVDVYGVPKCWDFVECQWLSQAFWTIFPDVSWQRSGGSSRPCPLWAPSSLSSCLGPGRFQHHFGIITQDFGG